MDQEIVIVSGLPRSGTSLMMQMLKCGGLDVMTDNARAADENNPRGYYELQRVKTIKQDASWLDRARGKVFKMVSLLLYDLPPTERYRIIFMERDLDEVLLSQRKMLVRLHREPSRGEDLKRSFVLHLERLERWLREQSHMTVLHVSYNDLLSQPLAEAQRVSRFLGGKPDARQMASAVVPSLYRNRKSSSEEND